MDTSCAERQITGWSTHPRRSTVNWQGTERVWANLKRFQQDARQRLRVLETAASEAGRGHFPEAAASVRRVARSIGNTATDHGLAEIQRRAEDVVSANTHEELVARARALISIATREPVTPPFGTAMILAVEDDPVSAHVLRAVLEGGGHQLVVTDRATEAQRLVGEQTFDLLFLDLVLPDADGRDLLVALRQRPPTADIPVIVSSAMPALRAERECLALGAHAYLEKPLRAELVRSTVSRLLWEEGEAREVSAASPSWVANLAALREAYGDGGSQAARSTRADSLARIEIGGEDRRSVALHEMLSEIRECVGTPALMAADPSGRTYALLPGIGVETAAEILRGAEGRSRDAALSLRAGVVDVSRRPPLREAMARADRLLYLAGHGGPERVVIAGREPPLTSQKVLFVEDDRVTARLVTHRLGKDGFEVIHYDHGQAALEAAVAERVALAIIDVKLPGMDGFQLLQSVRRLPHFEGVPVIMLTSMGSESDVVRGFELGADDYVLKPFSPVELLARIHRLLEGRGLSRGS